MPHGAISKPVVVSSVLTAGFAGNLAKGQLAIVKNKAEKNKGAVVVSDFAGMTAKDLISIRVGEATTPGNLRIKEVASKSTGFFPIGAIVDIKAYAPTHVELKVDNIEIGYDGINADSGIFIPEGKAAVLDIMVYGQVASMFFGRESYLITKQVYRAEGETMQEVIKRTVKELNDDVIPTATGWASTTDKLSQFLEIGVIDSENVALVGGTPSVFSTISVKDNGDSNDLSDIQAQYPTYKVVKTDRANEVTTYTILHLVSEVLPSYAKTQVDVTGKGCEDCLAGYSLIEGGYVYHVSLEDDGVTQVATVQAIPGAVAASAIRFGNKDGKGLYSVVVATTLTEAQIATFLTANPTAEFRAKGEVVDVCSLTTTETFVWVDGDTCEATTKAFNIILKDNECGQTRLAEVQATYPDLTITATGVVGGCKRQYTTTVKTNLVCDECADIYLQPFYGEVPEPFEGIGWEEVVTPFDVDAKMGIFIKGKPFFLYPEAYEEDFIPFMETSLKVRSASFGQRQDDVLNYTGASYNVSTEFAKVVHLVYAQDVDNLSQSLFGAERMGNIHFTNKVRHNANLFARTNLSQERILGYGTRVVQFHIQYRDNAPSQMAGQSNVLLDFMILVEQGKAAPIQLMLNKLAAKVELEAFDVL